MSDSLTSLYQWAKEHLGQSIMLGYTLHKVNGQIPGYLSLLLQQRGSLRPDAEIQIEYVPERDLAYQVSFSALPFTTGIPRPERLHIGFNSPPEVIYWLRTGYKRIQLPGGSGTGDS